MSSVSKQLKRDAQAHRRRVEREAPEFLARATSAGREAFARGARPVPALDREWERILRDFEREHPGWSALPLLQAWTDAWHAGNMAAPMESATIRDMLEALEVPVDEGLVSGLLRGAGRAAGAPFGLLAKGAEAAAKRLRAKKAAAKRGAAKPKPKAAARAGAATTKPAPKPGGAPKKPRAQRVTGADAFRRMSVQDLQRYVRGRNPSARTLATRELARRAKAKATRGKGARGK